MVEGRDRKIMAEPNTSEGIPFTYPHMNLLMRLTLPRTLDRTTLDSKQLLQQVWPLNVGPRAEALAF
ncbi:MAG: hypothetical protein ACREPU_06670 [Rhodanobacteraceae bacterium]